MFPCRILPDRDGLYQVYENSKPTGLVTLCKVSVYGDNMALNMTEEQGVFLASYKDISYRRLCYYRTLQHTQSLLPNHFTSEL